MRPLRSFVAFVVLVGPALAAASEPPARVILVSFDGAGHDMTSRLIAEGRLPNFARLIQGGAWSDGMVSSFPTKTAAAHAMIFTGHYGHTSGITGNAVLKTPASEHSRLEATSGYMSGPLRVEPLWIRTAKAGLSTYVLHGTQAYPFGVESGLETLNVVQGYTETRERAAMIDARGLTAASPAWSVPEARGAEARELAFSAGDSRFYGLFFDDPFDPAAGCDTLGVVREREDPHFLATVKPGDDAAFSQPVRASLSGKPVWFSLRLFELSTEEPEGIMLFRTGAVEVAVSSPWLEGLGLPLFEVFDGNGAARVYLHGGLGPPLFDGGDGTAENRWLLIEEHLQEQLLAQARFVFAQDYRFIVLYSPVSDDVAHALVGLATYREPDDGARPSRLWEVIARGFALQDRFLGEILDEADRDGAHVLVVSDHGMVGTDRVVHLNLALEQAGLLALEAGGRIDLSRTQALALPLADHSIAVNADDRLGGIVPASEKADVLQRVRRVLTSLVDPDTGERVISQILEPATSGLLQPGGARTGDLFIDLAPGYEPSTSPSASAVIERVRPRGTHGYLPTRRDMRALFGAYGPSIPAGFNVGRVRAIDVAPTVLSLLELDVPPELPGRSLVPERGVLQSAR